MGVIRRREVKTDIEGKLLTGLVVSTRFCREILPLINLAHLQSEHSRIVTKWVKGYWEKFHEAPGSTIQDIYEIEKDRLRDEATGELVRTFLANISAKYEQAGEPFNDAYHVEQSLAYLNERSDIVMSNRIQAAYASGRPEEAGRAISEHRQVQKVLSRWVNPFDADYAEKVYDAKFGDERDEDKEDFLFKFPGILGDFLGPFERGWLIAWMGPLKRGKSWWLWETTMQLVMNRRNVIFITLEMDDKGVASRGYKRIMSLADKAGEFAFPVFDCKRNQDGTCDKRERTNRFPLLLANGVKPKYDQSLAYRPCTVCRGQKGYKSDTWYEQVRRERITKKGLRAAVEGFRFQYGDRLWLISYPKFGANLSTVKRDIDELAYTHDFRTDAIGLDYANILAPEDHSDTSDEQSQIDTTWKSLGKLADTEHALVYTGVHSTRETLEAKNTKAKHIGRDIRIGHHVDALYTLNQTDQEKLDGVMRVGIAAHRWREYSEIEHVKVLQQLSLGQVAIDSSY